jgi:hypothetical protein
MAAPFPDPGTALYVCLPADVPANSHAGQKPYPARPALECQRHFVWGLGETYNSPSR